VQVTAFLDHFSLDKGGLLPPAFKAKTRLESLPAFYSLHALAFGENQCAPDCRFKYRIAAKASISPANLSFKVTGAQLDSNGWPIFAARYNTRLIYVSSSTGNDNNTGLSPQMPLATIAKGEALLRNGYPDHLLLKAGDTFVNQTFGYIRVHGQSASAPMVIGTYGAGPAPVVETPNTRDAIGIGSLGGSGRGGDFLIIEGVNFYAYQRDPSNPAYAGPATAEFGTRFLNPITDLTIVGCNFNFYTTNIVIDASSTGPSSTVTLYRNVVTNAWSADQHSQGVYIAGVANPIIEQNVFDHNGWNASIPGAHATIFNHNLYLQYTNGLVYFSRNISANSATDGVMVRSGGTVTHNLFVHNAMGPIFGTRPGSEPSAPILTSAIVSDNVILQSTDVPASPFPLPRSQGIVVSNARGPGVQINNNIIAQPDPSSSTVNQVGIRLDRYTSRLKVTNNLIFGFAHPIIDTGDDNVVSPNVIDAHGYANANVSIGTYNSSLGGDPTVSAFLVEADRQSKNNWRVQYTAADVIKYVRAGFTTRNGSP